MEFRIYKYDFTVSDIVEIKTHHIIKLLKIGKQNPELGILTAWILIDPESEPDSDTVQLRIFVTGHPISSDMHVTRYIDTIQDGPLVWHIYYDK